MKIYVIRHGETTGDVEDRYGGSYDDYLTEKGREQLVDTASKLVGKGIEKIFSSSLTRAKESSEIISEAIGAPIETLDGLRERDYGVLGGLTKVEALEKYPEAVEAHKDPLNTDPDGESWEDFQRRTVDTFESLAKEQYGTIAIVSHGGPIKRILAHLGLPLPEKLGDGEIIEIEATQEGKLNK
ncbi:MAG: histidine phosphatase family protein [Candidatus Colwellbacteria bacterium CG10_big_fil_rev_8_21_14_0_10_42_22]|uniref:Histidine phosphatase family protein n=1 Tax=Candidatus Colwellbacteria bacterium CG10_big_fil_rev_8_21_14_0_10_42_22 TaxID=1974540 RepID=A0A2H0VGS3_9BACT|nr:MAG: histidine phosphatase family protein [Candidatus Colwellbacteria bacterium CG10_big_fil_rev_8_21_14_0_10_42_22]